MQLDDTLATPFTLPEGSTSTLNFGVAYHSTEPTKIGFSTVQEYGECCRGRELGAVGVEGVEGRRKGGEG